MNQLLIFAFLFFLGSTGGWITELIFRRFFSSSNPEHKWINPGFCIGPYLPIYGFGLSTMYLITCQGQHYWTKTTLSREIALLLAMALCMTLIEYVAGILSLKVMKTRLWDYTDQWGNLQGVICPLFSVIWAMAGAGYYYVFHSHVLVAIAWLSQNLAFSFVIGMFYGVFLIDVIYSTHMMVRIREFASRNNVIVKVEHVKAHIQEVQKKARQKTHFFLVLHTKRPISEWLRDLYTEEHSTKRRLKKYRRENKYK